MRLSEYQTHELSLIPFSWQQETWLQWSLAHQNKRLPHAVLLTGNEEARKEIFALAFAHTLLCQAETKSLKKNFCGTCPTCLLLKAKTHPDLFLIEPQGEISKIISIEEIRNMQQLFQKTSHESGYKIALIQHAHTLTRQAANAFLKLLEGPPQGSLFILMTKEAEQLFSTMRSRCQVYRLPSLSSFTHQNIEGAYAAFLSDLVKLTQHQICPLKLASQKESESIEEILSLLQKIIYQIIVAQLGGTINASRESQQHQPEAINHLCRIQSKQWLWLYDKILEIKKMLSQGINLQKKLLLEMLFSTLHAA